MMRERVDILDQWFERAIIFFIAPAGLVISLMTPNAIFALNTIVSIFAATGATVMVMILYSFGGSISQTTSKLTS